MPRDALLAVDFAALRTLILVHETNSFTATAQIIGVNQSAVSYTIDKLRKVFQDPLFFRQGPKMVPTARCEVIVEKANEMAATMAHLAEPSSFDPATARQSFVIACNYYERLTIIPPLVRDLRKSAPGISLKLITSSARGDQQLKESEADLLIGPLLPNEAGFFTRRLILEHYVCVLDRNNPLAGTKAISRPAYLAAQHLGVTYDGNWRSSFLRDIEAQKLELSRPVKSPSLAGLSDMIQGTDLLATVPSRVATSLMETLHVAECPFPSPFPINSVWTARTHDAPSHIWLRNLITQIVQDLPDT